jgi:hypothetical protein
VKYATVSEFLEANPDCCEIVPRASKSTPPGFLSRITGRFAGYVHLRHNARVREPSGNVRDVPAEAYYAVTTCGRIWEHEH